MNARRIAVVSAALLCCLALSREASASSVINGYTSISYNSATNLVTGVTTTELDYSAQEWYMGRVIGKMTDSNGNSLGLSALNDTDRDGTVSATVQAAAADNTIYTYKGTHGALADFQDYWQGAWRWVDYHNFGHRTYSEGIYVMFMAPFYGPGPRVLRSTRPILLGNTADMYDTDLVARVTATGATFSENNINRQGGQTELRVQISTTRATPVGTVVVVEIQEESNPSQVQLDITSFEEEVTVNANQNGRVIIATFSIRTRSDNPNGGQVAFRATISEIRAPGGATVQNGTGGGTSQSFVITNSTNNPPLTVKD